MAPGKSPEELEWERAAGAGRAASRKNALRVLAASGVAGLLMVGAVALLGTGAEKAEEDKEERLARGETVVEVHTRGMDDHVGSGMLVFFVAGAAGLAGFIGTFFALGGRLSAEHRQGLSEMMRR
jgi:hypothetical protein